FLGRDAFDRLASQSEPAHVEAARCRVRVRDTAAILYTSGTTANPKGCVLSHEALTRGPLERARRRLASSEHDVTWGAGPLFHIGSLAPFIGSIGAAGTYLTDTYFEPGRALALMTRERVTTAWPWFPAIVQALLDHASFDPARLDALHSLILIGPQTLIERVQRLFPAAEILQACGMTETAGIYALSERADSALERATN
ncbi:AMP-binding protein, partial [Pandoraea terrae]|uniref:AMP-binding protein n=1 Tax=Pandoraea terrae TaxID=1537710 RepID=UPI00124054B1